jgi:adenosylcobinamide hydrolase
MIAVVADSKSPYKLKDSGKHSKLGELIGTCIIEATKEALQKQTGLTPKSQCDVITRLGRFGIKEENICDISHELGKVGQFDDFSRNMELLRKNQMLVGLTGSILHIIDEVSWGLLSEKEGKITSFAIMKGTSLISDMPNTIPFDDILNANYSIIHNWMRVIAWLCMNSGFTKMN